MTPVRMALAGILLMLADGPTHATPATYRITGCVVHYSGCGGSQEFGVVVLQPLGRSARVDLAYFTFEDVPPGIYQLSYSPSCNPAGCTRSETVEVVDRDVSAGFGRYRCPECRRLGSLSIGPATIEPAAPRVGELVRFAYDIDDALPGSIPCAFWTLSTGGSAFGEEEMRECRDSQVLIWRRAIAAGIATAQLSVEAQTELECYQDDSAGQCNPYYRGTPITAQSAVTEVLVAPQACEGDCDGDGSVSEQEVQDCLPSVLPIERPLPDCCDADGDHQGTIDELLAIANNHASGCP